MRKGRVRTLSRVLISETANLNTRLRKNSIELWFFQWSCMDVRVGLWRRLSTEELMLLNCGVGEDSWESLGLQGDPTSPFWRRSTLGFLWKKWCLSWNSSTLATACEELSHYKRLWCWEGLGAGGEGDDRGWDGWMATLTWWTWIWVNSGRWWRTGRPGVLRFMESQRVRHNWATELNWTELVAQAGRNPPAMQEPQAMQVRSLDDPLEEEMVPTPVFWHGESHGQRRLVGYSPQNHK